MKIYVLVRNDEAGYDEYDSKVFVAKNEKRAREIANRHVGDEGEMWTDTRLVACEIVDISVEREVVGSFNAG
jgi:hypothetical protein